MAQVGDNIAGRYTLRAQIGSGAASDVWDALDEWSNQPVAVKITASPAHAERFRIEMAALAKIRNPNVVNLRDGGVLPDGRAYLVFDRADRSLERLAPMEWREAAATVVRVVKAVAALHAVGIIHRDIKPSNILLIKGEVRLADLGTVGLLEVETHHTQSGQLFGTPVYMSPEQIMAAPQGPETDVWGIGTLLY